MSAKFNQVVRAALKLPTTGPIGSEQQELVTSYTDAIADRIRALEEEITGPPVPGEDFLDRYKRLQTARLTAESDGIREVLASIPEELDPSMLPDPQTLAEQQDDRDRIEAEQMVEDLDGLTITDPQWDHAIESRLKQIRSSRQ